jgi:hypothetical protein
MPTPDQHLIDELYRNLKGRPENGNGHRKHAPSVLYDEQVISLCRKAKNAARFASLYDDGDLSAYDGDDSSADAGLLGILAFYTQNYDQLERIWGASALGKREKFNRADYRRRTIEFVLSGPGETRQSREIVSSSPFPLEGSDDDETISEPESGLVWVGELGNPEPRKYIAEPAIPKGHTTVIHGGGGSAKSLTAADFALRYTNMGGTWLGFTLQGRGKVLFVDFELDANEFNRRVRALAKGAGLKKDIRGLGYLASGDMQTPRVFAKVRSLCKQHEFDVVVIDSVGPALEGDVGSSKDVIGFHRNYITPLRAQGVTPILIDHQARAYSEGEYQAKGAYGNSYKEHLSRSIFQVEPKPNAGESGTLSARVRHKKANFSGLAKPFDIEVVFDEDSVSITRLEPDESALVSEKTVSIDSRILCALQGEELDKHEIAEKVGQLPGSVANRITALKNSGKIVEARKEGRTPIYGLVDSSSSSSSPRGSEMMKQNKPSESGLFEERFS